jgi:hypothetical protein
VEEFTATIGGAVEHLSPRTLVVLLGYVAICRLRNTGTVSGEKGLICPKCLLY